MNTQTHLLMATALLLPAGTALATRASVGGNHVSSGLSGIQVTVAALFGALLPDASLFVMFFIAKAQGVADSVIWSDWYYSHTWQQIGAVSNSIPLFAGIGALAYALHSYLVVLAAKTARISALVMIACLAALLHCFADLPLHHDDGHPHFWPFSDWIYSSPVSYWDPSHYGNQWSIIELILALALIVYLWRGYENRWSRGLLLITGASYGAVALFWFTAFGS